MASFRDKLDDFDWVRYARMAGSVVLSMGCVILLIWIIGSNAETGSVVFDSREEYDKLREDKSLDAAQVTRNAASIGSRVASIQNELVTMNEGDSRIDGVCDKLMDYVVERSYDKCVNWYEHNRESTVVPVWTFDSTFSFSGDDIGVVWTCRNKRASDELLCYATGKYSAKANLFYDIDVRVTDIGKSYATASDGASFDLFDSMDAALKSEGVSAVEAAGATDGSASTNSGSESPAADSPSDAASSGTGSTTTDNAVSSDANPSSTSGSDGGSDATSSGETSNGSSGNTTSGDDTSTTNSNGEV